MSTLPQGITNWDVYPQTLDTKDEDAGRAVSLVNDSLVSFSDSFGSRLSPSEVTRLQGVINDLAPNESLLLMPGVYQVNMPLVLVKPIRLVGLGRVVIEFDPNLSAVRVSDWVSPATDNKFEPHQTIVDNICFRPIEWSVDSTLAVPVVQITSGANRTQISRCSFTARRDNVIKTAGSQTRVTDCAFHGGTVSGGADIYYEDGALRGIVHGNLWSTTRTHVLSYKTGTNMSEAANGPAAIVQVRI